MRKALSFLILSLVLNNLALAQDPLVQSLNDIALSYAELLDSNQLFCDDLCPSVQKAVSAYKNEATLDNGLLYCASLKNLNFENIIHASTQDTLAALAQYLTDRGFEENITVIRNPVQDNEVKLDDFGQTMPYHIWTHQDGAMVKVKPIGDAKNKYRPQPHMSKACRYPYNADYKDFKFEAFKVDILGRALPKWPKDLKNPYGLDNAKKYKFIDYWGGQAHIDLQQNRED